MKPNDIEELLQQYGADQRQQQQATDHVRHLAHRQAQRRTAAACVAVLVAIVGVVTHRWQQLPEPIGTLVAEQPTIITPHTPTMPPSIEPTATLHPNRGNRRGLSGRKRRRNRNTLRSPRSPTFLTPPTPPTFLTSPTPPPPSTKLPLIQSNLPALISQSYLPPTTLYPLLLRLHPKPAGCTSLPR